MRIVWEDFSTWSAWLHRRLRGHLKPGAIRRWRGRAASLRRYYDDDDRWLKNVLASELLTDLDSLHRRIARFRGVEFITAFHGSRMSDPGIVHQSGLQLSSWTRRAAHLEGLLTSLAAPQDAAHAARRSLQDRQQNEDVDIGKLFCAMDSRDLVERCGHYLLLGSEFAAGCLHDFYPKLRCVGVPTVFVADVPLKHVEDYATDELAWLMLREWVRLKALSLHESRRLDFPLILHSPVRPEHVRYHFHPLRIMDPHNGCVLVTNSRTACRACIETDVTVSAGCTPKQ